MGKGSFGRRGRRKLASCTPEAASRLALRTAGNSRLAASNAAGILVSRPPVTNRPWNPDAFRA